MIRRPPRSTLDRSSAASDVYKRQDMGIAILETDTMEEAAEIMTNDPAVKGGIMSAELFEFSLALYR